MPSRFLLLLSPLGLSLQTISVLCCDNNVMPFYFFLLCGHHKVMYFYFLASAVTTKSYIFTFQGSAVTAKLYFILFRPSAVDSKPSLIPHCIYGLDGHGSQGGRQACEDTHKAHHDGCEDCGPEADLEMGSRDAILCVGKL